VTAPGVISSWKTEFQGGLFNNQSGVAAGVQLKVLREISPGILQVMEAAPIHDPRPILQTHRIGYPNFATPDSAVVFTESGLSIQAGDIIGLSIFPTRQPGRPSILYWAHRALGWSCAMLG
jgi:hypothetical protein